MSKITNSELATILIDRINRLEDKLMARVELHDQRISGLEEKMSRARGWITACFSLVGLCMAFLVEWVSQRFFGGS